MFNTAKLSEDDTHYIVKVEGIMCMLNPCDYVDLERMYEEGRIELLYFNHLQELSIFHVQGQFSETMWEYIEYKRLSTKRIDHDEGK